MKAGEIRTRWLIAMWGGKAGFWFRARKNGWGFSVKSHRHQPPLFSERYAGSYGILPRLGFHIGQWCFEILRPLMVGNIEVCENGHVKASDVPEVVETKPCPRCGIWVPADSRYCGGCGNRFGVILESDGSRVTLAAADD